MGEDPGVRALAERMAAVFRERERADLGRLEQVLGLAACRTCLTGYVTRHFGEKLEGGRCGHCDRCRGVAAKRVARKKARTITDEELRRVGAIASERLAPLMTPRQFARFLCGMKSPAATRAGLWKRDEFGMLADVPFDEVMAVAEAGG